MAEDERAGRHRLRGDGPYPDYGYRPDPAYGTDRDLGPGEYGPDAEHGPDGHYGPDGPDGPDGPYDGYEQHGPDETPALLGRLVRLPSQRADLPEAVRDCLRWGIFALVLVPVFLVATGGSVLNAVLVVIAMIVVGVVVIGVVRFGQMALPNLEPAHQLEPLRPSAPDPVEAEWQDEPAPTTEWRDQVWPRQPTARSHWDSPLPTPPPPPLAADGQPIPDFIRQPNRAAKLASPAFDGRPDPSWPSDQAWRPERRAPASPPTLVPPPAATAPPMAAPPPPRDPEAAIPSWPYQDQ